METFHTKETQGDGKEHKFEQHVDYREYRVTPGDKGETGSDREASESSYETEEEDLINMDNFKL